MAVPSPTPPPIRKRAMDVSVVLVRLFRGSVGIQDTREAPKSSVCQWNETRIPRNMFDILFTFGVPGTPRRHH